MVSKGRETLHRAIKLVQSTSHWGARVVYGDTDSLFVLTPGRTRQEAFRIGAEIAAAVTQDNPRPVKLKLEKVYQPCILQVVNNLESNYKNCKFFCRLRNAMWATCTKMSSRLSLFTKRRESKLSDVMVAQLPPKFFRNLWKFCLRLETSVKLRNTPYSNLPRFFKGDAVSRILSMPRSIVGVEVIVLVPASQLFN